MEANIESTTCAELRESCAVDVGVGVQHAFVANFVPSPVHLKSSNGLNMLTRPALASDDQCGNARINIRPAKVSDVVSTATSAVATGTVKDYSVAIFCPFIVLVLRISNAAVSSCSCNVSV